MTNTPSNDTSMELAKFLNYPDILDVTKRGADSSSTDEEIPCIETKKSSTKRSRSHSPSGYTKWILHPRVRDTITSN